MSKIVSSDTTKKLFIDGKKQYNLNNINTHDQIVISKRTLTMEQCNELAETLKTSNSLKEITICESFLKKEHENFHGLKTILNALNELKTPIKLIINNSHGPFLQENVDALEELVRNNKLSELDLLGIPCSSKGSNAELSFYKFFDALEANTSISKLNLDLFHLEPEQIKILFNKLQNSNFIRDLSLGDNILNSIDITTDLSPLLKETKIDSITLNSVSFLTESAFKLTHAIACAQFVKNINIRLYSIKESGQKALYSSLHFNKNLNQINISTHVEGSFTSVEDIILKKHPLDISACPKDLESIVKNVISHSEANLPQDKKTQLLIKTFSKIAEFSALNPTTADNTISAIEDILKYNINIDREKSTIYQDIANFLYSKENFDKARQYEKKSKLWGFFDKIKSIHTSIHTPIETEDKISKIIDNCINLVHLAPEMHEKISYIFAILHLDQELTNKLQEMDNAVATFFTDQGIHDAALSFYPHNYGEPYNLEEFSSGQNDIIALIADNDTLM